MDRAAIVVDLGFGDAGKGLVTDYLVRAMGADLVVRFHGGAQAGHNVVTPDGRHHTFAQFGAGTFVDGVQTYLGDAFILHPTALLGEAAHLASVGVKDALERLFISEKALVITPFHQATNRLRELGRGAGRHGSCGVGVGETVSDSLDHPDDAIRAGHLRDGRSLLATLHRIQERKREEVRSEIETLSGWEAADRERQILEDPEVPERWIESYSELLPRATITPKEWIETRFKGPGSAVFEGAQGVLLDEWSGFHPYTTWSTCTFERAIELCKAHGFEGELRRIGVLRTYAVRHGAGPMPTEDASLLARLPEQHNELGPWQGHVRRGYPDMVLARYAVDVCGGIDALALTHLDALPRVRDWRVCKSYTMTRPNPVLYEHTPGDPLSCTKLKRGKPQDLDHQAALTDALMSATPVYETMYFSDESSGRQNAIQFFEEAVGAPVTLTSEGLRATDVRPT